MASGMYTRRFNVSDELEVGIKALVAIRTLHAIGLVSISQVVNEVSGSTVGRPGRD